MGKSKNIAYLINNLNGGGAEKLILTYVRKLNTVGLKVDLILLDGRDYPFLEEIIDSGFNQIIKVSLGSSYNILNVFKLIKILSGYKLIHVHLFPSQYFAVLACFFLKNKPKLIFTEHSTENRRIVNFFYSKVDYLIYYFYDVIICVSNDVYKILSERYSVFKYKMITIENGIDLNAYKCLSDSVILTQRKKFKIESNEIFVVQVSSFRPEKDQKTLIKAFAQLPQNIKLFLVGEGVNKNDCENLVEQLGLVNRVFFLGFQKDINLIYNVSDIVILSSKYEGLPLSLIEAMAIGRPIIASNVPGIYNVINDCGLLFEYGDHSDLANKIKYLSENIESRVEFSKLAKLKSILYSDDSKIEILVNLYKKYL
jgi:glycosyltransferase involved in cell wall biosynthesis